MKRDNENEDLKDNTNKEEVQNRFKKLYQTLDNLEKKLKDFPEIAIKN